ncbi:hypothetical protein [Solimonas terrae]|uniref:Lipoprotein n=1 Tax=Solimonas terrae TaxID=1396819 RepID=A0A6M2BTR4_9GAMM|nr:hypothetical protein [Solimonas terrae]NGY06006.1 hypothetical protein [Solimonas terrae]
MSGAHPRWRAATLVAVGLLLAGCESHYDPLAAARVEKARAHIGNVLAHIPPQCYTQTDGVANPCWVCHTAKNNRNAADDWQLQAQYQLNPIGRTNHWTHLFVDRRQAIAAQRDADTLTYVRHDNYAPLRAALQRLPEKQRPRWVPDLDLEAGFDADGFARDGSAWRAFRYKPFPGTFWPTNGATDDVMIRLPAAFRQRADGSKAAAIYRINLAIVEAAIAVPDTRPDAALDLPTEPLDERAAGFDLDGDGRLAIATRIHALPAHYAGAAAGVAVRRYAYPLGTEFMHGVYYLDPQAPGMRARRLKELRYARKIFELDDVHLQRQYDLDAQEQQTGGWPYFGGDAFSGIFDEYGWQLQAYIERADGRLRLQTREEQMYCMGCHSGIGITVDGSFSLPRKLPGAAGWGEQDLAGMVDAPQAGSDEPEYQRYLRRTGGGDEYRANAEMLARFFPRGRFDAGAAQAAAPGGGGDLRSIILPSPQRALLLDKAYRALVREQDFALGRDALPEPALHVHRKIDGAETGLREQDGHVYKDGRIWLDWPQAATATPRG